MWIIYTRPGCHLCEDAVAWIDDLAAEYHAQVQLINILDDSAAYALYRWAIPVLRIGDAIWEAPLNEQTVREALAAHE